MPTHPIQVTLRCSGPLSQEISVALSEAGCVSVAEGGVVLTDQLEPWCVVVVATEAEAARALEEDALDALVWPQEKDRLVRALWGAQRQLERASTCRVYREAFRRNPSWLELTTDDVELVDVSAGFERFTGYSREEAVGRTTGELFRGGTHGRAYYDAIGTALQSDGHWHGDMLGRLLDGTITVLDATIHRLADHGGPPRHYAVKQTSGVAAPGSLNGWLQAHVSDPWILVDRCTDRVLDIGPGAPDVLGIPRQDLVSRSFADMGFRLELPDSGEELRRDVWIGQRAFEVYCAGKLAGDAELALVVFRDVTERLRREEELDALAADLAMARDQALAADQAKSAFLAGMSHELRTPLTAILGYADILREDLEDMGNAQLLSDLSRITTAGTHLLGLVDEVLDLARVESGEVLLSMEEFQLRPLLEEVADSVRLRASESGKEVVVVADGDARVFGDRQRVLQVVLNLIVNAVKYAHPGRVEVGLEHGEDGCHAVFVQDEGPGLTLQQQGRIFHAFRQLHDVSDGVGLGLAISRRLAEAMGGALDVVSRPGEGSRFRLWLKPADAYQAVQCRRTSMPPH